MCDFGHYLLMRTPTNYNQLAHNTLYENKIYNNLDFHTKICS